MSFDHLHVVKPANHVLRITLFRPDVANAINTKMAEELMQAMKEAEQDPLLRCIIVTGEGQKVFCSGADLKERQGMDKKSWQKQHDIFETMLASIADCTIPVIAQVNGAAYAGGLELALACDFVIASDNARFAFTEANLGIMPGLGGATRLPRAMGSRRALQMLLTAQPIGCEQALFWGIVNEMTDASQLAEYTLEQAIEIANNAPLAVKAIKKVVHQGLEQPMEQATKLELAEYNKLIETKDRLEGINAFNEKRLPQFVGE